MSIHDRFRAASQAGESALRQFIRDHLDDDRALSLIRQALNQLIDHVVDRRNRR